LGATEVTAPAAWPDTDPGIPLGDGRLAHAEFQPGDVQALCETIRDQVALGRAIYPQGGKTSLDYGGTPARPGVAVSAASINRLIDYPYADMTITVEAGMTLSALSGILAAQQQRLLVDAPFADRATIGGVYATGTTGPRRFGAGRPRDQIIGVSFVTSEGVVVKGGGRVVKNVAGYDLPKLLTGSLGTLGMITQLTMKVRPIPEKSAIAWVCCRNLQAVSEALDRLNVSETRPIAVEFLNGPAARKISNDRGLPIGELILAVGYEENAPTVSWQLDRLKSELKNSDLSIVDEGKISSLWASLIGFQALTMGPLSFVANVRPSSVVSFVARLDPEVWAVQSHAGNGIVRAHLISDSSLNASVALIGEIRRAAGADGGNLVLSHCPADWKEPLRVWGEPRADWAISERVNAALDPHHAMNPGRFVGRI
jgi:glycolate oxidase FAD binding subunit